MFESVYTCTDWYDGPRGGIADYQGLPHLFQSEWRDIDSEDKDTFLLSPVDEETFRLALEDWAIWLRWEAAFRLGNVTQDTHPSLPEERSRHEELQGRLEGRLIVDSANAIRKAAEFRAQRDSMEVQWVDWGTVVHCDGSTNEMHSDW